MYTPRLITPSLICIIFPIIFRIVKKPKKGHKHVLPLKALVYTDQLEFVVIL